MCLLCRNGCAQQQKQCLCFVKMRRHSSHLAVPTLMSLAGDIRHRTGWHRQWCCKRLAWDGRRRHNCCRARSLVLSAGMTQTCPLMSLSSRPASHWVALCPFEIAIGAHMIFCIAHRICSASRIENAVHMAVGIVQ